MKIPTTLFSLIIICLFTFSCGTDFYIPEQANLLILEEKDDIKVSLAYNHVQAAYSPINHWGTKGSFTFSDIQTSTSDRNLKMGHIGLGYYSNKVVKPLKSIYKKTLLHPKLCLIGVEAYANISLGKISSSFTPRSGFFGLPNGDGFRTFDANLLNPHISSQIYWQSQSFSLQFGVRAGLLYYYNAQGFGDFPNNLLNQVSDLVDDTPFVNVQYDILLSKGNDRIETFAQVTWNQASNNFIINSASFSFGLKMNIPKLIDSLKGIKRVPRSSNSN